MSATTWSTTSGSCIHCGTCTKARNQQDKPAHQSCETAALERERRGVVAAALQAPGAVS